jgi:hypothetical protein
MAFHHGATFGNRLDAENTPPSAAAVGDVKEN